MADGDGDGAGVEEQRADAVPNQIPNDCNMATELVPEEMENDNGAYRTTSQKPVRITTKRSSRRWISLPKDFTWRSNERITRSPTGQSH
jgi:hypothetical protein